MWDQNGQGDTASRRPGGWPAESPRQRSDAEQPDRTDVVDRADITDGDDTPEAEAARLLDALAADDAAYEAYQALAQRPPDSRGHAATLSAEAMRRAQARALIREFLRAVPRAEAEATLALVRPDGTTRLFTRAQLTTAIERLRPRQRQIIRLGIEERWPRQKVCDYLRGISIKTLERDQVEALDILASL